MNTLLRLRGVKASLTNIFISLRYLFNTVKQDLKNPVLRKCAIELIALCAIVTVTMLLAIYCFIASVISVCEHLFFLPSLFLTIT